MSNVLDIFKGNAFNVTSLTDAINNIPHKPGRVGELGLFSNKGVTQRQIIIEERDGVLQLLVSKPYGAPAEVNKKRDRRARNFMIPHFPLDDTVLAAEVQGIRAFGSQSEAEGVAQVVTDKIASMRQSHEVTLEWLRIGAIKGVVFDGDTTTVLYDYYNEFNVRKQADQDWDMHTAATEQAPKITAALRLIETALGGTPYDHIHCLMGDNVWDKFVVNTSVKTALSVGLVVKMDNPERSCVAICVRVFRLVECTLKIIVVNLLQPISSILMKAGYSRLVHRVCSRRLMHLLIIWKL